MTDVPPDHGAPGSQPLQPWDPSGIRRSSFTPPAPDAEPPTFDDDALAEAMAAEVSPYTSEIKLPHLLPPEGAEFGRTPAESTSVPGFVPPQPIPLVEPSRFVDSAVSDDTTPIVAPTELGATPDSTSIEAEELRRAIGGASTLEAMDRLEDEFRRISNGEPPSLDLLPSTHGSRVSESSGSESAGSESSSTEPSGGAAPQDDVFAWLSAATAAPPANPIGATPATAPDPAPDTAREIGPDAAQESTPAAAPATVSETVAPVAASVFDLPAPGVDDPAHPVAAGEATAADAAPAPAPASDADAFTPLPGTDALGWNASPELDQEARSVDPLPPVLGTEVWSLFPDDAADEVFSTPAGDQPSDSAPDQSVFDLPLPNDAEASPAAFAWLFPASTADVAPIDEPIVPFAEYPDATSGSIGSGGGPVAFESLAPATAAIPIVARPESTRFPGLPPVDESLIDPDAAAAVATPLVTSVSVPPPTPVSDAPWTERAVAEEGVWDLGSGEAEPPREPVPSSPNPAIAAAAAAAAAALVAAAPPVSAPAPAPTPAPGLATAPAPEPWVESREAVELPPPSGPEPQLGVATPVSTEPPVGPESPDWLGAPPPSYTPPELVEPPPFLDTTANPALDPVSPITANTMARLPVPLPNELPNIADRAELPPPPGYEDIPIMSGDAAAQSTRVAPLFFGPAAIVTPALVTPVAVTPAAAPAEPLLPVPPSASPYDGLPAVPVDVPIADPHDSSAAAGAGRGSTIAAQSMPDATEPSTLDLDDDDAVDEVDRVGSAAVIPVSALGVAEPVSPPSEPLSTARLSEDQPAIVDEKPKVSAIEVESAGVEPTALDLRTGRAARLFWLWFAANSSVVSLGLGAVLLSTGMSLRQSIVATLTGIAISFLPLGLGTLAGKWSGQPTMVVSRAAFGHTGNILPAVLAVLTRVFWGGVLLWLLATAVAQVLVGAGLDAGLGTRVWQLVGLVVGFVLATVVAVFGYGFVARLQLVLSIVNGVLILGVAALTFQHLDFAKALTVPDGSWVLLVGGAAIVFSVIGLAWVHSSSDIARYQRPGSLGGASMLWATFGATLPPFLLICWGAMLAASDPALASRLQSNPLAAIAGLLPAWYPAPLVAAASLGLLSGAVLTIYSGGFAVQALGVRLRRSMTTLISAVLVLATAGALLFVVVDFSAVVRSVIITLAVPVAAWAGIFASEMMIRTRRFHTPSLLAPGGIYPQVRWVNLIALVLISALSFGFVTSNVVGFGWEGFLFTAIGTAPGDPLGASNVGVFVALVLGLLVPLAGGVPAIRRQEARGSGVQRTTAAIPIVALDTPVPSEPAPQRAPTTISSE
jgi:purine-cytosine permease-like protein